MLCYDFITKCYLCYFLFTYASHFHPSSSYSLCLSMSLSLILHLFVCLALSFCLSLSFQRLQILVILYLLKYIRCCLCYRVLGKLHQQNSSTNCSHWCLKLSILICVCNQVRILLPSIFLNPSLPPLSSSIHLSLFYLHQSISPSSIFLNPSLPPTLSLPHTHTHTHTHTHKMIILILHLQFLHQQPM